MTKSQGIHSLNSGQVEMRKFSKSGFRTAPDSPSLIFSKDFCAPAAVFPPPRPDTRATNLAVDLINPSNSSLCWKNFPSNLVKYPRLSTGQISFLENISGRGGGKTAAGA